MGTARAKEQTTAPEMFDGAEDMGRKDYGRKGKSPRGHSGKSGMRKHKRSRRR